jgi:hypothetical protein
MSTATEIVIIAFAITNGLRVVAYLPQIIRLARDETGAAAVSCCTWFLFLVSNISTATYAALVLNEPWMTVVFTANAVCSAAIVVLSMLKRRRLASRAAGDLATRRTA